MVATLYTVEKAAQKISAPEMSKRGYTVNNYKV